ncbi:folate-biopterin transporter family [Plasmopara halstedii]|uniref:Folate-biopterin transporter family n=1 Tax=Plasmopara halstedii TaxID=4781 RepID=A0A0P1AFK2_PLAHL|nr:folate-biopterin transporter family [Plasmopara halstedii]CEG39557.1 folate-biopterin transporter family [Plasmopara halstedii]|eukprot:XP_024575926.1 folate-biopterin transporter family [Plasmopara halstedii]
MTRTPNGQNRLDLQCLSVISASKESVTKDHDDGFTGAKTPGEISQVLEDGAIRPGGMPNLMSRDHIGLVFQYAAVGVVYGMLPGTVYPLMQQYLNCSGAQVSAAKELVILPWSFKVFYGITSDCFPIFGYRRRPYMLLGWSICIGMLLMMAFMPIGPPYYSVASDRDVNVADYTPEIKDRINYSAPSEGANIVCELAQQEPLAKRGKTQSAIYAVRTTFVILAPAVPFTWFFIREEKAERLDFGLYISDFWNLLCKRVVYQVIAHHFFAGIFSSISYTASSPIQSYLVGVTPINNTLNEVLGHLCFMTGIMVTSKYGLHWNWRAMIVVTGAIVIAVDCSVALITIWDIFRNQWFWLGPPIAVQIPSGVAWIIALFVTVEIAGTGHEGAIYGLMTTVGNLAAPFASTLTLIINAPFDITNARVQNDDRSIREDITFTVIISYVMTILSWGFLVLLPPQKKATQELARTGGSSKLLGGLTVAYLSFALIWSLMANTLAIFESTSCLLIAGGRGC